SSRQLLASGGGHVPFGALVAEEYPPHLDRHETKQGGQYEHAEGQQQPEQQGGARMQFTQPGNETTEQTPQPRRGRGEARAKLRAREDVLELVADIRPVRVRARGSK